MSRPLNRPAPALPVGTMQTFSIRVPEVTHYRPASCAEVDCPNYLHGWRIRVEGLTAELLHEARNYGHHRQLDVAEGETWLVYEAGQPCFQASTHRVRLDRPELYVVRGGDWRGNPTQRVLRHSGPDPWLDDFQTNQQTLADLEKKG
jgi:hypothetical protein